MEWISVNDRLPELENGEPKEVKLLTDFDGEELEGFYEGGTWWIKLGFPFIGHQDYRTIDIDFEITHWKP